jgi:hypothetical protein
MKFSKIAIALLLLMITVSIAFAANSDDKFPLKDVSVEYSEDAEMSLVEGEITNNSGKSYETAIFKLSFYDETGKLLGAADIAIMNFEAGDTVTFDGISEKDLSNWETYKVRLDMSA